MIESILIILLLGLCDRVRGGWDPFDNKFETTFLIQFGLEPVDIFRKACQFGYGFILGFIITHNVWLSIASSILWWLGEKPSWRKLFNELSGLEIKEDYLFHRFMLRGFVWAAPCLPLAYFDINILLFSLMTIVFPLSAYWGYKWQTWFDEHAFTELTRGMMIGAFIFVCLL